MVVVNNSTDGTAAVGRQFAVRPGVPPTDLLETPGGNTLKKAGALNIGVCHLLRQMVRDGEQFGTHFPAQIWQA